MRANLKVSQFIRDDIEHVTREIGQRRLCRHTLFIAILGMMGTAVFALIAIIQSGERDVWKEWILIAALLPMLILSAGILTTINKARAINIRSGYLAALAFHLRNGKLLDNLSGWINALRAMHVCTNMMHHLECTPCECELEDRCVNYARRNAEGANGQVRLLKFSVFKSFGTLIALIYTILYIAASVSVILAAYFSFKWDRTSWNTHIIIGSIIFAAGIFFVFSTASYKYIHVKVREKVLVSSRVIFMSGAFIVAIAGTYKLVNLKEPLGGMNLFALGGAFLMATALGYALYDQVWNIRKGKYSIETYYHLWRKRIQCCLLMRGGGIYKDTDKPDKGRYKCLQRKCGGDKNLNDDKRELGKCTHCGRGVFFTQTTDTS